MSAASQPVRYHRFNLDIGWEDIDAHVITEAAVSLTVNGDVWLSFTCTPTDLEALSVGFLYNEAVI